MKLYAKVNSGAAALIWVVGFFVIVVLIAVSAAIERQCVIILAGWTSGLITILLKNNANNKLDLEAAKATNGTVANLNIIKQNSEAPPCSAKVTD